MLLRNICCYYENIITYFNNLFFIKNNLFLFLKKSIDLKFFFCYNKYVLIRTTKLFLVIAFVIRQPLSIIRAILILKKLTRNIFFDIIFLNQVYSSCYIVTVLHAGVFLLKHKLTKHYIYDIINYKKERK